MLIYREKKKENTDIYHHDYGALRNCGYILGAFKKYRKSMPVWMTLGAISGASMAYIWTIISKLILDMIEKQAHDEGHDIMPLLYLTIGVAIAEFFMLWLKALTDRKVNLGNVCTRFALVQERIAKTMSMEYEQLETPEMLDRLQKAKRAAAYGDGGISGFIGDMQNMLMQFIAVIAAVGIISTLDLRIVLVIFVLSFIQFEYFDYIRVKDKEEMWDAMAPHWRKMEYMWNITSEISYAKDIRLYRMKKWLHNKQHEINTIELSHWKKSRTYWMYNSLFGSVIALVRNVIIYGWLIYDMLNAGLSVGDFVLYTGSAITLSGNIRQFLESLGGMRMRSARLDDFRSYMDIHFADEDKKTVPIPKAKEYEFKFENVSFKYQGQEKYALKNLNLTLHPGQRLAVVGLNGAGKTTFIKLLLRLYDVTEGRILCNGIDIREFDRTEYFKLFAPAFQEVEVFAFPLSENVSMKPESETDKKQAEEFLRMAGMGEKLDKLPHGIDTEMLKVLYEDGVDLSGGEKQKMALARALYKKAPIVVLDEPTAALDALAEYRLYQSFDGMIGNRTAVYISHRLSSTRFCDNIAMFAEGEMVEFGTHDELLAKNGAYAEMFRVQAQYYINEGIEKTGTDDAEGCDIHE